MPKNSQNVNCKMETLPGNVRSLCQDLSFDSILKNIDLEYCLTYIYVLSSIFVNKTIDTLNLSYFGTPCVHYLKDALSLPNKQRESF